MFRIQQTFKNLRLNAHMSRQLSFDLAPPQYKGSPHLGTFNRDALTKSLNVLAVQTLAINTGYILKAPEMRGFLIDLPKIRSVDFDPSDPVNSRLVLLRVSEKEQLSSDALAFLETQSKGLVPYTITLDYDYWPADDVIRAILPEKLTDNAPSGFAATGHIAHLNLNEEYLPYKHLIGQIILDKNKNIRTVVNKLDTIDSVFRVFNMELIAGEPDFIVEHSESDCKFVFDFREVYWNSRLHTEHSRLIRLFQPEDVIADVFAGVGPFSVPAAKKGCAVFANDLNPQSVKFLNLNIRGNHVGDRVRASCEDGRDFIRSVFRRAFELPFPAYSGPPLSRNQQYLAQRRKNKSHLLSSSLHDEGSSHLPPRRQISHFVMNLPDSAITFLSAFRGVFVSDEIEGLRDAYDIMPMIHCHCFTRELELEKAEADIRQRVEDSLGAALTTDVSLHLVRSVAPNKEMYCISFRLPSEVPLSTL